MPSIEHPFTRDSLVWIIRILIPALVLSFSTGLCIVARPVNTEEIERAIVVDWFDREFTSQTRSLSDLVIERGPQDVEEFLSLIGTPHRSDFRTGITSRSGHLLPFYITSMRVTKDGRSYVEWPTGTTTRHSDSPISSNSSQSEPGIRKVVIPLESSTAVIGQIEIAYRFFGVNQSGLGTISTFHNLQTKQQNVFAGLVVIVLVLMLSTLVYVLWLRERGLRVRSQEEKLNLSHQMCHELRNALWAFRLENKNVVQMLDRVQRFISVEPSAFDTSADRLGLEPTDRRRLRAYYESALREERASSNVELERYSRLARTAHQQIDDFAHFVSFTVDELDRSILGVTGERELKVVRLRDVAHEATQLMSMRLRDHEVDVTETVETEDDWVLADRYTLVHVFVNLIKNALEAMNEVTVDRCIRITVASPGARVVCRVFNSGTPIPEEIVGKIFTSGFSTKGTSGRGRGLASVRKSLREFHGSIQVDCSLETGVCFELSFPTTEPPKDTLEDAQPDSIP